MDGVKRVLNQREMSVEQARMIMHDRSEWRAMVNKQVMMQPQRPLEEVPIHLV